MTNKNHVIAFVVSFVIGGFFLLTFLPLAPSAHAGLVPIGIVCCVTGGKNGLNCAASQEGCLAGPLCPGSESSPVCDEGNIGDSCTCPPPPQIPTLNQWGKIITMVVIGLFAVIGLIIMRRRNALTS